MKNKQLRKEIKKAKQRVHKLHKQLKTPLPPRLFRQTKTISESLAYLDMTSMSKTEVQQVITALF